MRLPKTMLAGLLLFCALAFTAFSASAQKDKIEGIWYNEEKTSRIQIYKATDGKFWGKIIWLKEPNRDGRPKTDIENPNKRMRNQPLINLPVLRAFKIDDEKTYDGGKIYDPKNGKTYSCIITWRNANELGIRGYVGVSMLGRTTTWTRAN